MTLRPDYYFVRYTEIKPEWLLKQNIKFVLSDLDGTLAPDGEEAGGEFAGWLCGLQEAGIALLIVSNNTQRRVHAFAVKHKIVGVGGCGKPGTSVIRNKLINQGLNPDTALFVGDQIFTDLWCAKKLGVRSALVTPIINNKENYRMRVKRAAERWLIKKWNLRGEEL